MASREDQGSPSGLEAPDTINNIPSFHAETQNDTRVNQSEPTERDQDSGSESESGSSYDGTASATRSPVCSFRNAQYHDDECSLFFDCPTHQIQRAPADNNDIINHEENTRNTFNPARIPFFGPTSPSAVDSSAPTAAPSAGIHNGTINTVYTDPSHPPTGGNSTTQVHVSNSQLDPNGDVVVALEAMRRLDAGTSNPSNAESQRTGESVSQNTHPRMSDSRPSSSSSRSSSRLHAATTRPTDTPWTFGHSQPRPRESSTRGSDIVLPRWQPDSEVTSCPICHTDFSFFIRRHHCRKCGRVVCNSCSPHRITIPSEYVVRAPGEIPLESFLGEQGIADLRPFLSGGEKVRMCNPCVPDPNPTPPPQPQLSPTSPAYMQQASRSAHQRSQSNVGDTGYFYRGASGIHSPSNNGPMRPFPGTQSRSRSATVSHLPSGREQRPEPRQSFGYASPERDLRPYGLAFGSFGNPRTDTRRRDSLPQRNHQPVRYFPSIPSSSHDLGSRPGGSSSQSHAINRPLPLPPNIPEEDQCPVCHNELPSRSLLQFERLREEHITSCIEQHSGNTTQVPIPGQTGAPGSSPVRPQRLMGMITYIATEKDCKRDDGAQEECSVCYEDYEPGQKLARLECWCRFHYRCIMNWFNQVGPGKCPIHNHDTGSHGY